MKTKLETGVATDIDGNRYLTIKIGEQWWMSENLKVTKYCNGDAIPNVTDGNAWDDLTTGAYCSYDNDPDSAEIYGYLYNWYAVNDPRGLAPAGWHVASDAEWQKLVDHLGGNSVAGGKMKETALWASPNTGATNESGFSALPGGYRRLCFFHRRRWPRRLLVFFGDQSTPSLPRMVPHPALLYCGSLPLPHH